jgi:hypothetical protein
MPSADFSNRIRELGALSKQQSQKLATAAAPAPAAGHTRNMSFAIGAKVLDLVTGEKGVVIDGLRTNEVVPTAGNASS